MKRFILLACIVFAITKAQAQDTIVTIPQLAQVPGKQIHACANKYDHVILYAPENCTEFGWRINGQVIYNESPIVFDKTIGDYRNCRFQGCGYNFVFGVYFDESNVPNETTDTIWIRAGELAELRAVEGDSANLYNYNIRWNTGETTNVTYKPRGTYVCAITDEYGCDVAYRTKVVLENVELELATCDLRSNMNMLTWPVIPEVAEYIDHLRVYRDGQYVGDADYSDGYFMDNISSFEAERNYTVIAVTINGIECPIESNQKGTIHMNRMYTIDGDVNISWNPPTGHDLLGYNVCEWNPDSKDDDLTVIDYVGAGTHNYTLSAEQFNDRIVIQGVESRTENRLFSNRYWIYDSLNETESVNFTIYPNPTTNGTITIRVDDKTNLTIYDMMGRKVFQSTINGELTTPGLSPGIYTVRCTNGGTAQKVIVL